MVAVQLLVVAAVEDYGLNFFEHSIYRLCRVQQCSVNGTGLSSF